MINENKHFGVVIPASNLTIESEFYYILNKDPEAAKRVFFHFGRAGFFTRYKVSGEAYLSEVVEDTPEEVRKLAKILQLENIVFCCTSGALYLDKNEEVKNKVKEYFPKGMITPVDTLIDAMHKQKMSNILLVTPYSNNISDELRAILNNNDIYPNKVISLNLTTSSELLEYSRDKLFGLIKEELKLKPDYDGVCIMCTNFPTFHLLKDLEKEINKPVVSSNQSVVYSLFSRAGIQLNTDDAGSLFK